MQPDDMWLPGGYILLFLMEFLPGRDLGDFCRLSRVERDQVRKAFKLAAE